MELTCSCNTAEKFIRGMDKLTERGYAVCLTSSVIKDGTVDTSGFSTAKYVLITKTSHKYSDIEQLNEYLNTRKEYIRFWLDRRYPKKYKSSGIESIRNDRAGIKFSDGFLDMIIDVLEIVGKIQEVGNKVSNNKVVDLDAVIDNLNNILEQV